MSTLFNRLIKIDTLHNSWKSIKAKNRGGGIDGVTIESYDKELHENILKLRDELKRGEWKPEPYLRISIPKKNNERRVLGILTINDKIVQQAIKFTVEPYFEKIFSGNSYGYRPGKGAVKAIKRLEFELNNKQLSRIVKFDIDNYFDNIDRDVMIDMVKDVVDDFEISRLIDLCIRMGVVTKGNKWKDSKIGVPQGAVISPLLANLYLTTMDRDFDSNKVTFVRYADDFVAVCKDDSDAKQVIERIELLLGEKLKLRLNPTIITPIEEGVDFLGVRIHQGGLVTVNEAKQAKIYDKIESISLDGNSLSEGSIESIVGIKNYYGRLLPNEILKKWDKKILLELERVLIRDETTDEKSIRLVLNSVSFFTDEHQLNIPTISKQLSKRVKEYLSAATKEASDKKNHKLISSRKLEYQRREAEGLDLVINTFGYSVGFHKECVVVKKDGHRVSSFGHNLRHITILSEGITLSSNLIRHCAERSIPIDL